MLTKALEVRLLKVGSCRHLECLAVRGGRVTPIVFPSLAALIMHPDAGPILFDTGYAEHFHEATQAFPERLYRWATPVSLPAGQRLERQLARYGVRTSDIKICVVSHFHADHIAGLRDLPSARIITLKRGYETFREPGQWRRLLSGSLPGLAPTDLSARLTLADSCTPVPLPQPWDLLGQGHYLLGDGSLIGVPLPGHSPGHMGLLLRDHEQRGVLFAADSSWSSQAIADNLMPSRLVRPIFEDWDAYRHTLQLLHRTVSAHRELVVLPSHCEAGLSRYDATWGTQ
jgi:glyoxylase-like metal-dependent hydrolase (beta-lactamase superfamily II)